LVAALLMLVELDEQAVSPSKAMRRLCTYHKDGGGIDEREKVGLGSCPNKQ
jgi:hypothetical protein